MVSIAVLGHGVVGSGVVEVLSGHRESLAVKAKEEIHIKYILDIRDFPNSPFADRFVKDFEKIVSDPEVRVVVEVMGGLNPAYDYVKRSLLAGKSVVTSNKELVAAKGAELLEIAQDKNVNFLFEASVGGGIPIIRPISQCLAANEVLEIAGILNGTTNFILTKMIREQMTFEDALSLAQKLGYAERNPAADIEGHDACRKICILASLAFGKHVYPEQVYTEGITGITLEDVSYAEGWGGVIKLIGRVKVMEDKRLQIVVAPMLLSRESQLSSVDDVFNGIMVRGDAIGDVVFYGRGAGKLPTASAVVADVIDCIKHFKARKYLYWSDGCEEYVADYKEDSFSFYVRLAVPGGTEQKLPEGAKRLYRDGASAEEYAFVTPVMTVAALEQLLEQYASNGIKILSALRIAEF